MERAAIAALAALLSACDAPPQAENSAVPAGNEAAAPMDANPSRETVLKSETVEAVFTGWEVGDYVWANLEVKGGAASGAWVGPPPLEHFLEAHKGQPITVRIDTVRLHIPEAGGEEEVRRISDAAIGGVSAAAWWQSVPPAAKEAAERRMEEVLGGGV